MISLIENVPLYRLRLEVVRGLTIWETMPVLAPSGKCPPYSPKHSPNNLRFERLQVFSLCRSCDALPRWITETS